MLLKGVNSEKVHDKLGVNIPTKEFYLKESFTWIKSTQF